MLEAHGVVLSSAPYSGHHQDLEAEELGATLPQTWHLIWQKSEALNRGHFLLESSSGPMNASRLFFRNNMCNVDALTTKECKCPELNQSVDTDDDDTMKG